MKKAADKLRLFVKAFNSLPSQPNRIQGEMGFYNLYIVEEM